MRYGSSSWTDHRRQIYRNPWRGLTARDTSRTRQTLLSPRPGERVHGVSNSILNDKNKPISFRINSHEAVIENTGVAEVVPRIHRSFVEGMKTFNKSWGQNLSSNPNPSTATRPQHHISTTLNSYQWENSQVAEGSEDVLKRNQDLDLSLSLKVARTHDNLGECLLEDEEKEHDDHQDSLQGLSLSLSSSGLSKLGRTIRKEDQTERKIVVLASPLDLTL
ncbi:PREDICTED: uncharacterized protein LOC104728414 [Camelina sativa]|uniref:Uncharacterized protein LOC104728414 n=1 Tax=Camelina sativa TaxID=90675 RepID=A0ABM0USR7_CAMSA|nr:PREDICTED: uncharacterized protein LOC104728414 [Camelina sativa]